MFQSPASAVKKDTGSPPQIPKQPRRASGTFSICPAGRCRHHLLPDPSVPPFRPNPGFLGFSAPVCCVLNRMAFAVVSEWCQ
jgi:hypothetical protein